MRTDHAVHAEGLVKNYGRVRALAGLDLDVAEGSLLALLGPNGAGKTTAVRIFTTLLEPDAGHATVAGFDVVRDADRIKSQIGLAGQNVAIDEYLTGLENLEMIGQLYHLARRDAKRRAQELLMQFDLIDAASRIAKTYSGGMRRRLDLAASLVLLPPVLFLDEPTTGLDHPADNAIPRGGRRAGKPDCGRRCRACDRGRYLRRAERPGWGESHRIRGREGGGPLPPRRGPAASFLERGDPGSGAASDLRPISKRDEPAGDAGARLRRRRDRHRRPATSPAESRRCLPHPHRSPGGRGKSGRAPRPLATEAALMATASAMSTAGTRYQPITGRPRIVWAFLDALVLAKRSVLETVRVPELIMFVAIHPIMFVLLFRYVFGGAIQVPGGQYVNYLMPGIFVQTVAFGGVTTAIGLAQDMQRGIIDRFRSLPMSSSAVLTGRTIADLARNLFTVIIMLIVGFLVGFRPGGTPFEFLLGILVLLGVSFAFSWISAFIGLLVRSVEAAQSGGFIWLFPLTFASSAFVPVATMPSWLRGFAEHNPVSVLADSLRGLFHVNPALTTGDTQWALIQSAAWIAGILLVFIPLSVIRYRNTMAQ